MLVQLKHMLLVIKEKDKTAMMLSVIDTSTAIGRTPLFG